jgi:hypothetical protein
LGEKTVPFEGLVPVTLQANFPPVLPPPGLVGWGIGDGVRVLVNVGRAKTKVSVGDGVTEAVALGNGVKLGVQVGGVSSEVSVAAAPAVPAITVFT